MKNVEKSTWLSFILMLVAFFLIILLRKEMSQMVVCLILGLQGISMFISITSLIKRKDFVFNLVILISDFLPWIILILVFGYGMTQSS